MPTVNLGRVKMKWRGVWAGSTAYAKDDIVRFGADTYVATTAHTSDATTFSNDSANWETMAQGAEIPSQSGQAGKVLKTDGSTLSWGEDTGGQIVQVHSSNYDGHATTATNMGGQLAVTFAPQYADSNFLFMAQCYFGLSNHDIAAHIRFDISGAAPGGTVSPAGDTGGGDRVFALSSIGSMAGASTVDDWGIFSTHAHYYYQPSTNMGTSSRVFQVLAYRGGNAGSIIWNERWDQGTDSRNFRTMSTLTVMEIRPNG